jgi:hypothetical protein
MLHTIQRHKVNSHPFPPPSSYSPFSYRNKKYAIGKTFPTPPLSLCSWGAKVDFGGNCEIRCGIIQLQHRVRRFLYEYSLGTSAPYIMCYKAR